MGLSRTELKIIAHDLGKSNAGTDDGIELKIRDCGAHAVSSGDRITNMAFAITGGRDKHGKACCKLPDAA